MDEYPAALLKTLQAKQEAFFFKEALELYIPPQVGRFVGDDEPKDAAKTISQWLNNPDKQCLLLLGDSGAGKTLFGQWLTREFLQHQGLQSRIPLFIPLLAQKHPSDGLIDRYLKKTCGIEDKNQREFIKQQRLLLIFDGFDEIHTKINLYQSNKLWQLRDAKIIISCRSQALAHIHDYASLFCPCDKQNKLLPYQLQEFVVNPFTEKQIDAYLQQYVSTHQVEIKQTVSSVNQCLPTEDLTTQISIKAVEEIQKRAQLSQMRRPNRIKKSISKISDTDQLDWSQWETYQSHIQKLPGLQSLLTSPFVLSIVVQVLPSIIAKYQGKESTEQLHLAKINLYDHFVNQWFKRQKDKLLDAGHISITCPIEEAFTEYSKALAHAMLQKGVTSVEYTPKTATPLLKKQGLFSSPSPEPNADNNDPWAMFFVEKYIKVGQDDIKLSLIRAGCPLMKLGENQYAFLHKSLLEYFAARKLFEGAMNIANIALGFELNEKLLVDETDDRLNVFAERVEQDDKLKECLFDVLEESKYEERVQVAAANAITILNYAKVSFSQRDLRHIRISGADLSNAILYKTDLREADLRNVKLHNALLAQTKLGSALIAGVQFGEFSYFQAEEDIYSIAYSPNGRYLASGHLTIDGGLDVLFPHADICLWDIKLGKRIGIFKGHIGWVSSIAFSSDGKLLASGSHSHWNKKSPTVRLWDVERQKALAMWEGHTDVSCVAFSPDNKILVSAGDWLDGTVRLWDVITRKELKVLRIHCSSIAFRPDGRVLAFGNSECLQLWDLLSEKVLKVLNGNFSAMAFSPDWKVLASGGSDDNSVYLWDLDREIKLGVLRGHTAQVNNVVFSPNGHLLASCSKDGTVRLWDIRNQKALSVLYGHKGEVDNVVFSPDGQVLASGGGLFDGTLRLWDISSPKHLKMQQKYTDFLIGDAALSPNEKIPVVSLTDNVIHLWDVVKQKELGALCGHTCSVTYIAFSPNGQLLVSGSKDGTVYLWDTVEQKILGMLREHTKKVDYIAFSLDGLRLASRDEGNTTYLWEVKSQKALGMFIKKSSQGEFSPDGKIWMWQSDDYSMHLWDVEKQRELGVLQGHKNYIWCNVFSSNGRLLATGDKEDGSIYLWNVAGQNKLGLLQGHAGHISGMAFSSDGKLLASCGYDQTVRLWDTTTQKALAVFKVGLRSFYNDCGVNVAFSPDGQVLVSTDDNYTVYLWNVRSQKSLGVFKGHNERDSGGWSHINVVFSSDGRMLASKNSNTSVCLFDMVSNICLFTVQLKFGISSIVFKKIADQIIFCARSGGIIYTFEVKMIQSQLELILLGTIGNSYLMCDQMDMGGAVVARDAEKNIVGTDASNERLLIQRGAVGKLSMKNTEDILEVRRHAILYNPKQPPYNLFSCEHFIMPNNAMVSFVRKKEGKGRKHVFLVIEYINESGYYIITQADFFLDQKQKHSDGVISSGQALIEIFAKPLSDMQLLAPQCVYKCWKITNNQVYALLANLEADRLKRIDYVNMGNSPLYNAIESGAEKHNCLTWCEGHLTQIGIDVSEQQSWLDVIVAHPKIHLPVEAAEPNSQEKCSIM